MPERNILLSPHQTTPENPTTSFKVSIEIFGSYSIATPPSSLTIEACSAIVCFPGPKHNRGARALQLKLFDSPVEPGKFSDSFL